MFGSGLKVIQTVDCHAGGEPARIVVSGIPPIPGDTMYDKRNYFMEHHDDIRKLLLQEPRGYPCQNADVILPSNHPDAEWGFLVLEQAKIYPLMSGHNTICVVTAMLETGMVKMEEPQTKFNLEAPCGIIKIVATCKNGKCVDVTLRNTPAFAEHIGVTVKVPEVGDVPVDIAFGGMWYTIVEAERDLGVTVIPENGKRLSKLGEMIKVASREQYPVNHPNFDYPGSDILVMRGAASKGSRAHAKNAVIMSNGELSWDNPDTWTAMIDRSPCGSGTCAVMSAMYKKGELSLNEDFIHESIVGSIFTGRLVEETTVGEKKAVVPEITGQAWITQFCQVVCHPSDPFPQGYTVGDIWS